MDLSRSGWLPLPDDVVAMLERLDAPLRLVAHLQLVHDVAVQLVHRLAVEMPGLVVDREAVLFGAATHDIGKIEHPGELTGPGSEHEEAGRQLLLSIGVEERFARFAGTHGTWDAPGRELEDLLVAVADKVWKGKRVRELEECVAERTSVMTGVDRWETFLAVDRICEDLSAAADERLAHHAAAPVGVRLVSEPDDNAVAGSSRDQERPSAVEVVVSELVARVRELAAAPLDRVGPWRITDDPPYGEATLLASPAFDDDGGAQPAEWYHRMELVARDVGERLAEAWGPPREIDLARLLGRSWAHDDDPPELLDTLMNQALTLRCWKVSAVTERRIGLVVVHADKELPMVLTAVAGDAAAFGEWHGDARHDTDQEAADGAGDGRSS